MPRSPSPHRYTKKAPTPAVVEALIFDWAGTLVDYGSFAPTQILVEAFAHFGLELNLKQARSAMGKGKWDHIQHLLHLPPIQEQFYQQHQRSILLKDIDSIYAAFLPLQIARVAHHSQAIAGARTSLLWARSQGLKLGSCTGYPRSVMNELLPHAEAQGLELDLVVCSDEVSRARPWPAMALENVSQLSISHVAACVKIDDTVPGIQEGHAAGMWTVGLVLSGNACGLSWDAIQDLDENELAQVRAQASQVLEVARPHYLIDSVADLPPVIRDIQTRLEQGERP